MSDDNIKVDEEVVEQLTGVADTMTKLLEKVMERHDHQSKDMDYFRSDLGEVRDAIRRIAKVLHEGNGEKPLIARVAVLETEMSHARAGLLRLELERDEEERQEQEATNINTKGKWALRVAVASGICALIVEVIRLVSG